jgi:hypothetical protein
MPMYPLSETLIILDILGEYLLSYISYHSCFVSSNPVFITELLYISATATAAGSL